MARKPSPRPSFEVATHIRRQDATLHLWGDPTAGHVGDRIFVSSLLIHQLELTLPPGSRFTHSEENRTIFDADEVFYVLEGTLVLANPQTGEVHRVLPGEAAYFRRDTWHHGFNHGTDPVRVLELFAPPPAQGTSSAYARKQPYLENSRYLDETVVGRWPQDRESIEKAHTIHVVRPFERAWHLGDEAGGLLVGIILSTEHLTVAEVSAHPGAVGLPVCHEGDTSLFVIEGRINVHVMDGPLPNWFEVDAGDGFYLPSGTTHRFVNEQNSTARLLASTAPTGGQGWTAGAR